MEGEGKGREFLDSGEDYRGPDHRAEMFVKKLAGGWAFKKTVNGCEVTEALVIGDRGKTGETIKEHPLKVGSTGDKVFVGIKGDTVATVEVGGGNGGASGFRGRR